MVKIIRGFFNFLLVLVIVGGLGYIVWSYYGMPNLGNWSMNMSPDNQGMPNTGMPHGQPSGNNAASENNVLPNTIAIQNKDRLNQAVSTINQAIDLITIDPYSTTTIPDNNMTMNPQTSQGPGAINIYPSGSGSININPAGNIMPNNQISPADTNMGTMNPNTNISFVYDQGKLQQLHTGIYKLAQAQMLMEELNEDLTLQSTMAVGNSASYEAQITQYNLALQNKTKLNNVMSMMEQVSVLVNVNPYGGPGGYQIDMEIMGRLHQGVFKLAQGITLLDRLNQDFADQMSQAAQQAQATLGNSNTNLHILSGNTFVNDFLNSGNVSSIFSIILIVMVATLLISIFGAILSLFRTKPKRNNIDGTQHDNL